MTRIGCLLLCLLFCLSAKTQDLSNKGKDFWIAYPAHVDGNTSVMGVYITSDEAATGTVSVGGTNVPFSIAANSVKTVFIGPNGDAPNTSVYLGQQDGVSTGAAIHVTSNRPVVVYAHIIKQFRSGASLLLPSAVWGKAYIVPSISSTGQSGPNSGAASITVVAKDTNTVVEINPKATTQSGKPAGVPYSITLAKPGDVYQVQFQKDADISGTTVRSLSTGNATCKPIGVFSASTWSAFDCFMANGGDNLYQQLFPVRSFGKNFITAPFYTRNYDIIRVFVADPTAIVKRTENNVTTTLSGLQNNSFYEFKTNLPNKIEADKPISVVQYITSQNCYNNTFPADPEMVILSPLEQTINNITVFSAHQNFVPSGQSNVSRCYLNIIIKTSAAASFTINGNKPSGAFVAIPGTGYSYIQADVTSLTLLNPVQTLKADSSFSAVAYGYGNVESYGYNAGTNVRDLYQYITIKNQYATVNYPATCVNSPFQFGITLPYQATKLTWNLFGKFPSVTVNAPSPDSSFVFEGKTLYRYSLNNTYSYDSIGTFPVAVTATNPSSDGCDGEQQIDYDLEVYDKPSAFFNWTHSGCVTDAVQFNDSAKGLGATVNRWSWDFGDNTNSITKNPLKKYNSAGKFTVKHSIITDVGCLADTTAVIDISSQPVAGFNIGGALCAQNNLQFISTATIAQGTITRWYWDFGNGKTDSTNTTLPVTTTYSAGTYTATFTAEASSGCRSLPVSKTFSVTESPTADFKLPQLICLPNGQAQFTNQTVIPNNVTNVTYTWNFGDNSTSTAVNPLHVYTTAGPFTIKLTATSANGCAHDTSKVFTDVYAQPVVDFTLPPAACPGDSSVFKDNTNTSNQTIAQYGWAFGNGQSATTRDAGVRFSQPGTFGVKHWVVSDKGCSSDSVTKNYTVNPLPIADFSLTSPLCENEPFTITSQSSANAGTLNRWKWNFGDGNLRDTTNGNPFSYAYASVGSKTVSLVVTSTTGCVSAEKKTTVQVGTKPLAAFGTPDVCLSDAFAQFTDSSTIADGTGTQLTYRWNFGDANATAGNPNTSIQKDARHRYTVAGNYNVSLTVTSKDGCSAVLTKAFTVNGDKPNADFYVLNSANQCSNDSVQIINQSTVNFGNITKTEIYWEWPSVTVKSTDLSPAPGKAYHHLYPSFQTPATKNYNVRFLAYSGGVCVSEVIKQVTVAAVPDVVFSQVPGSCPNAAPSQVTQVSTLGNLPGTGAFSGKGINSNGFFDPAVSGVGNHSIKYVFTSASGCIDSATRVISVWPAPVAGFTIDPPYCNAAPLTFKDASVAGAGKITKWFWDYGDGTKETRQNGNSFQRTYASTGSYGPALTVETDSGCTSAAFINRITINPLPQVDFSIPSICVNTPARFTDFSTIADNSQGQFKYQWNFGLAGATATQKDPVFTYPAGGNYNVSLQVTSKDGCTGQQTKTLTNINLQPLANFSAAPQQVCLGDSILFTDLSNPLSQLVTTRHWAFGDNNTSGSQATQHTYRTAGNFNVSFYYQTDKGCYSDTIVKQVLVSPIPVVNAGPDQFVLQGGRKTLQATVSGSANYTYNWSPATWLSDPRILQPVTSPPSDITYTLTVTAGGCTASDDVFVKFVNAPVVPNAFSPNGDGINDVWEIKYLDSYPDSRINVFDRYGRQVYAGTGSSRPWSGMVNGRPLPVGVYYYVVDPKNGKPPLTGSLTIVR